MSAALMIQGTGSDVGKSLIVAGLARAFTARGLPVRPFKPQNMSNNAAVTRDGGEIGRAQALQARACKTAPTTHMNPVLLKPETDTGAQVILRGKRQAAMKAREWMERRMDFMPAVLSSFAHLCAEADLVLIEGAGSPAEVNLREGDIANMGFAQAAGVPVVVVGNITVGGTGKTPLVIWLARFLREAGYRPGVISRGCAGTVGPSRLRYHPVRRWSAALRTGTGYRDRGDRWYPAFW